jgi:hypothetical protein
MTKSTLFAFVTGASLLLATPMAQAAPCLPAK